MKTGTFVSDNNVDKNSSFEREKGKKNDSGCSLNSSNKASERFSFTLFFLVIAFISGGIFAVNFLVDPLWYNKGNQITHKNFAFNERVSKTNQFLKKDLKEYDCLILGSSRVVALNASRFKENKCFNYSFKGAWAEDIISVSKFVSKQGFEPEVIYLGVDEFNFIQYVEASTEQQDFESYATKSPLQAYYSLDVLLFSLMTLLGLSPDESNYYDNHFETKEFQVTKQYNPIFYPAESEEKCNPSRISLYKEIRSIFPKSKIVAYIPPRSPWAVINETYQRGVLDCTLESLYAVSSVFDELYDFSFPSEITKNPQNSYDGSHFSPEANDRVVDFLEARLEGVALDVNSLTLESYQEIYKKSLRDFLSDQKAQHILNSRN